MVYNILIGFIFILISALIDAVQYLLKYSYNNTWLRYYFKSITNTKFIILKILKYITCIIGYTLLGTSILYSSSFFLSAGILTFIIISRLIYILLYNYLVNYILKI